MEYIARVPEEHINKIENLLNQFQSTWNAKDATAMAELFTDDAEFTDIMGQIAETKKDIRVMHEMVFQYVMRKAVLSNEIMYMRTIAKNTVLVTCKWKTSGHTNPEQQSLPDRNGIMQVVVTLKNNNWMIALVQNLDFTLLYNNINDYTMKPFEASKKS